MVLALLRTLFPGADIVDRRTAPSHGYRAVHVVVEIDDRVVEVQVRTWLQHLWAELSESLSDVLDPAIKYGGGISEARHLLSNTSSLVSQLEKLEADELRSDGPVSVEHTRTLAELKIQLADTLADFRDWDWKEMGTEKE